MVAMQFEVPHSKYDKYGNLMQAWFRAQESTTSNSNTAKYRFYMACDDKCLLKLGTAPDDSSTSNLKTLLDISTATSNRDYWFNDGIKRVSDWVTLTKGKDYYIEGRHTEGSGNDHFIVGVEIKDLDAPAKHQHLMKEMQTVAASTTQIFEQTVFVVDGVDDGEYRIMFYDEDSKTNITENIKAKATAAEFKAKIFNKFYNKFAGDISVILESYNANGTIEVEP
jgi:hypothetical protein